MPPTILITGAGIAGPTLATFLLLSPLPPHQLPHITILERAPSIRPQGQNIDIRGAGASILRKLGLLDYVKDSTTGEAGVQHVDARNRVRMQVAAASDENERSPTAEIEILRGRLAKICYERSVHVSDQVKADGGAGIEYIFGDHLSSLSQAGDHVDVTFAKSGARRSFDIVVGADGLQSMTRRLAFDEEGEKERLHRLGMYGGFFSMPRGETDSQWRRWYHAPGRLGIMLRPDDTGERMTVFLNVINEDKRLEEVSGAWNVQAQKELLSEYFTGTGWESERVMKAMWEADDFYYDMVAQVKMPGYSKGRVVLLGDAGYCASPISGMGTTLALIGAYNLAGALTQHLEGSSGKLDYDSAFAQYEERMAPVIKKAQKLVPGMPKLLSPETGWGIEVMYAIFGMLLYVKVVFKLLFMFIGPPADQVGVEEYGFRELPEWRPEE